jgi:hypothetical protein
LFVVAHFIAPLLATAGTPRVLISRCGLTVTPIAAALRLERDKRIAIGGLGIYDTFVHIDIRPGGGLARWDFRTRRDANE